MSATAPPTSTPPAHGAPQSARAQVQAAPPVVAPPPGHPRFPLVDSLRAIAALAVLLGHVGGASGFIAAHSWSQFLANGDQGVTLFFILSGFLLYRPFVNTQLTGAPRTRARDYLRRRVLRIVPAYWLALTLLALYPGLPPLFHDRWRYYFFLQVYGNHLGGLVQAWTLCVEMSFYLVLPLYAMAMARATRGLSAGRRLKRELPALALLSAASIAARFVFHHGPAYGALPGYVYWFALGMGLALVSVALAEREQPPAWASVIERHPAWSWAVALAAYAGLSIGLRAPSNIAGYDRVHEVFLHHVLGGVMALFLVLPAVVGARGGGWPRRVLAWRWLAWLGLISYGIYLWQQTASDWLGDRGVHTFLPRAALTIAISVSFAALSYYLVERPILRLKYAGTLRRRRDDAQVRAVA